ncbi:MAG: sterol desaturase family protein [Methylococcales bacterium]|nr:sterol desaturase family protein [Methylococcales bacterium]
METIIRLSVAIGIFTVMICWEYYNPRRQQMTPREQRWPINIGLAVFNMVLMRFTIGGLAYLGAINASNQSWGLLNQFIITGWLKVGLSILLLDLAIYVQHVISHKWKLLWQLHQIHHTDIEIDATTAVRFHPLEIVISMGYKIGCIYLIGADPIAVIAFEIILNATATFNHSNINLPTKIDRTLRWIVITPDIHRIHHSTVQSETDSNYGFSISLWDRLFKTYVDTPEKTQTTLDIGLPQYRKQEELGFVQLLLLPFGLLNKNKNNK